MSAKSRKDFAETACALAGLAPNVTVGAHARGPVGTAIALFYILLWSSAYVPSKIASVGSDPLWFLVARFLVAGAILAAVALAMREAFPRSKRALLVAAVVGILANALCIGLTYAAMQHHLSSGMGAILSSTNPLILALVAPQLLGERLTQLKILGLTLGFGGVLALVYARTGTGTAAPLDVMLALTGVCAAVASTILYKRAGIKQGLVAFNAVQLLAAGFTLVPAAALASGMPQVVPTWQLAASFAWLVLVVSAGASLLWFWLLSHGEASRVSAYFFLTPVFGLALAALFLHERVGAADLIGLGAIAAGIALVQRA
jgi:drug/metabolite transporter (DMT)-like permease